MTLFALAVVTAAAGGAGRLAARLGQPAVVGQIHGIDRTPLGTLVMASAAGDDLLTWATLALVVGFTSASTPFASLLVIGATGGLGLALAVVVRPALARLRDRRLDATLLSMSLAGLLL